MPDEHLPQVPTTAVEIPIVVKVSKICFLWQFIFPLLTLTQQWYWKFPLEVPPIAFTSTLLLITSIESQMLVSAPNTFVTFVSNSATVAKFKN